MVEGVEDFGHHVIAEEMEKGFTTNVLEQRYFIEMREIIVEY